MSEYIERTKAIGALCYDCSENGSCGTGCVELSRLKEIPAADVREVVHAKWIKETVECDPGYEWRKCSFCHSVIKQDKNTRIDYPWFCEECGSQMDGGKDNADS